jgi:hypothetical protein
VVFAAASLKKALDEAVNIYMTPPATP